MKKKNLSLILLVFLLVSFIFFILELVEPYFFLIDDNQNYFIYVYKYTYDSIINGNIPLYNLHQFLGSPFFATGQTGAVNPLAFISCFLSELFLHDYSATIDIMAFFHLQIAAIGMYLVLKKHDVKTWLSVVGAIAWSYNTFNIFIGRSWMIVLQTTAWIPVILLGTLYLYNNLSMRGIIISALPKAALFYCGHPQFFLWGMIYDFLYALIYLLPNYKKNGKNKKYILYYFISYIPVVLFALPLLGPMWMSMNSSASRSEKMDLDFFLSQKIEFSSLIPRVLNPLSEVSVDHVISRVGNFTLVLMLTFLLGVIVVFFIKNKNIKSRLVSLYILALLSCLFSGSTTVIKFMYLIPVINQFRYNFKYFMWFPFFAIIAACILLTSASDKYLEKTSLKKIFQVLIPFVTAVNIIFVCLFSPSSHWGLKMTGNPSNPPENLDELYRDNRYICIGISTIAAMDGNNNYYGSDIYKMEYNVASAYRYSNALGYDTLTSSEIYSRLGNLKIEDGIGSAYPKDTDFIRDCEYLGISTYILDNYYPDTDRSAYSQLGLREIFQNDSITVFRNDNALPIVRTAEGEPVNYEEKTNSIVVNTNKSFQGGEILLMYSYDPYFEVKVNGKSSDIKVMENDYYTMKLDAPSGENKIEIVYKDKILSTCLVLSSLGFVTFLAFGYFLENRKTAKIKTA